MIKKILDNRYFSIALLPLAIYNAITSFLTLKKEWKILIDTINDNDDFFKALGTLGFYPKKNRYYFETKMEADKHLSSDEINKIANTTIISIIMNYLKSESLLGIVYIECLFTKRGEVNVILRPSTLKLFYNDVFDFFISAFIYLLVFIIAIIII